MKKNVVAGLGEIGAPILKLISRHFLSVGYDVDASLMKTRQFSRLEKVPVSFLHVCIPFDKKFDSSIASLYKKFRPEIIVIHSTIPPYTTKRLQKKLPCPVVYSATRGVHKRMLIDLKRYTKFFAVEKAGPESEWAARRYSALLQKCDVKPRRMRDPVTLELAKIVVDTTYYGWLINYAQLSSMIAQKYGVDYDEMWSFSDDIHRILGNRPKMFPGFIGGHCVIPNLRLIDEDDFWQIDKINNAYARKAKNAKPTAKKHVKGSQSHGGA